MRFHTRIIIAVSLLTLFLAAGCSRQPALQAASDVASDQHLPFDQTGKNDGISPTASIATKDIPAGTPITIRLQSALSSEQSRTGDSFEAILDEPIIIDGQTVLPRGATVTGRVVGAKASGRLHDPGYLRL